MADISSSVPDLKGKSYSDFSLTDHDWVVVDLILKVLAVCVFLYQCTLSDLSYKEPRGAQASFSKETSPTVYLAIPTLECMQERWEIMAALPEFLPVRDAIDAGLEKLRKWYKAIDSSDAYYLCLGM